ncbi:hypothetical protein [Achromobacter xylosoxidans]|uniref:hypothetical protein n=1 Tax=Alcaligenes xylosoxydans xylosoxydans TaxID=85698 RepID=UPI00128E627B|nr:hypothetical protein [Achromobacter xylosoxidans]
MNFPNSKRIGTLGEMDIERLFISWSWNVGVDRIDTGYDLFVAPDSEKYSGARFLIQAKGTARKGVGCVVARVAKARLREYAVNVHPVFVVRVTGDGRLFWVHAQRWAAEYPGKLVGSGYSEIRFPQDNDLCDREFFERYLEKVLMGRSAALADNELEDSRMLNSLDSRVGVRLNRGANGLQHEIYAKSEPVQAKFHFKTLGGKENLERANEALGFGLPGTFDVGDLDVTGSPVFSAIAGKKVPTAKISIEQSPVGTSTIRLFPGTKFSINSPGLSIRARVYRGLLGLAVSTEGMDCLFDVKLLLPFPDGSRQPQFKLGIRSSAVAGRAIQELDELAPLANWVDKVNAERALYLETSFKGKSGRLIPESNAYDSLQETLRWFLLLGRLHLVAKALDSDFSLSQDPVFSHQDFLDINLAYALLKGETTTINLSDISFRPNEGEVVPSGEHDAVLNTSLRFSLFDRTVGEIPVTIRLSNFVVKTDLETGVVLLKKGGEGVAEISHAA